jgi:hypothetical protein
MDKEAQGRRREYLHRELMRLTVGPEAQARAAAVGRELARLGSDPETGAMVRAEAEAIHEAMLGEPGGEKGGGE